MKVTCNNCPFSKKKRTKNQRKWDVLIKIGEEYIIK